MSIIVVGGVNVEVSGSELRYEAGAAVDADGAPDAYTLPSSGLVGLDNIRNALHDTHDDPEHPLCGWAGVVVGADGKPVVQKDGPYAGYLLSPTALSDHNFSPTDYRRYVDAATIPYISVPPDLERLGARLGDGALVADRQTGRSIQAIIADVGPRRKLGEISVACARAIGIPSSPRNGGASRGVIVRIFLGSARTPAWDFRRSPADIAQMVDAFAAAA